MNAIVQAWNDSVADIQDVPEIVWSVVSEPLPPQLYGRNADSNALGFAETQGTPLTILLMSVTWSEQEDDTAVETRVKSLTATISKELGDLGALHPFVYLNYAAPWQDPIASYGNASFERLKRAQQQYDPTEVFTNQVTGGFKIKA